MDNSIQRAAESFIVNLTGASVEKIQEYIAEIRLNREFHNCVEENRSAHGGRRYSSWDFGIGTTLGVILYTVCRRKKPNIVVETGVASGVSSSHILCALVFLPRGQVDRVKLAMFILLQSAEDM
ncbi:hypothetical protein ES703_106829 [subsurface metagenome]